MKFSRREDLLALDIETSNSDPETGSILQIGAVHVASGDTFNIHIRHDSVVANAEAFRVNGIDITKLDSEERSKPVDAEYKFKSWLLSHRATDKSHFIPVGFNVNSFDVPYIIKKMPVLRFLISYRSIELNSLLFLEDLRSGEIDLGTTKEKAKSWAKNPNKHDALADAIEAATILNKLESVAVSNLW